MTTGYVQAAMAFLADAPERPKATGDTAQRPPETISAGPIPCVSLRCREPGLYLKGAEVLCEKHMRDSVRSYMSASRGTGNRHPHVLYCADGFKIVRRGEREDHRALGPFQRMQVCTECGTTFPVHWLWTGEPMPCSSCTAVAFQELFKEGG